ncbi:hypothetical protein NGC52_02675 [Klebsiella michiganensis]|uniref:Phage protein n=1 Tax=Klebsiella michiganensis TaxID=1134687 RepID=A0AAX3CLI1_9ENTR|nr:hypothetical protein [Klebsiella michiganensis]MEB7678681.1 hypothetical protein [Klebsiella michiganensis]QLW90612.1 hypothetical protein HV175_19435 [Klebsiella oxytoca]UWZ72384.1 hypothetical protein NP224_19425 [Klebsiella michiganensis]HCT8862500.1 hypothetical protein [Klebsiella michiganensis]
MAELRAGCQAMIIGGFYRTNDGKSVLVVGFVPNGSQFTWNGEVYAEPVPMGDAWLISGDLIARDGATREVKRLDFALMPGKYLIPIDGDDFSNEDQYQKGLEHA